MVENRDNNIAIPTHIGIIMDGNGRWAKQKGLPRKAGHKEGSKTFKKISKYCREIGVKYLTVFAFSTENWKRPKDEVDSIMNLLRSYLEDAEKNSDENARIIFIGDTQPLEQDLKDKITTIEERTKNNDAITVLIALNYGGR
ncbi:MAG: polyprenyl diphosphate synthase, partial [Oscillospiraceae bacterium]